jgi:hypothetical protein
MTHLVRQMSHVTFVPPDPERSAQDLVDLIGPRVSGRRDGTAFLTSNERLYEIAFRRAMKPEVAAIGLEAVDAGAVDEVRRRAVSDGLDYGWSMRADWPLGLASLTENGDRLATWLRQAHRAQYAGFAVRRVLENEQNILLKAAY